VIAIVDYGMGNRRSVLKALQHVGADARVTADPVLIAEADGLVVPGVGAFPAGMASLCERGLDEAIRAAAAEGRPVLGICLGMQLLLAHSSELGDTPGLGLIPGEVTRLQAPGLRIPHIGWNEVRVLRPSPLIAQLPAGGSAFYHVHSFAARPTDPADVVATTSYGETFASIIARGSVAGVQFHPEKSSVHGLELLGAFAQQCAPAPARA
jgi:glutamine amidotransferase